MPDTDDVTICVNHCIHLAEWKGQDVGAAARRAVMHAATEVGKFIAKAVTMALLRR